MVGNGNPIIELVYELINKLTSGQKSDLALLSEFKPPRERKTGGE